MQRVRSKQGRCRQAVRLARRRDQYKCGGEKRRIGNRWKSLPPALVLSPGLYYITNRVPEWNMCPACHTPKMLDAIEHGKEGWPRASVTWMCQACFLQYRGRPDYELRVRSYGYGDCDDLGTVDEVYAACDD